MEAMKRARQQAIGDVVRARPLRTQQELVAALRDKGFKATQATVSRDVTEMGLVKVRHRGARVYALPSSQEVVEQSGEQRLTELLRDLPIDVRVSGTLLVIRAVQGTAHAIAAALDRTGWEDVLGTIAGDDTVFVACADSSAIERTHKRLRRLGR
jgi:transcriptional regulator of arginine metabolism